MSSTLPDEPIPDSARAAWRADTASPSELRRGYARFLQGRARGRSSPRFVGFVVAGVLLGVGLAQAASTVQRRWIGARETVQTPTKVMPPPARLPARPSATVTAPAPSERAAAPQASVPRASASPPALVPQPSLPAQEQWQRAAAALRDRDFERARSALIEIERSAPAGAERDAARLARAQLLDSHGHLDDALRLADELARQARSEHVQAKARELAAQWRKRADANRSVTTGSATQ